MEKKKVPIAGSLEKEKALFDSLRYYFDYDDEWFDDKYIESEKRKKNEVAYSKKSKFQPYRCPKCKKTWRYYSMPKGRVPLREFIGKRIPMKNKKCPDCDREVKKDATRCYTCDPQPDR